MLLLLSRGGRYMLPIDCECTTKVAAIYVNEYTFPDIGTGIEISYCITVTLI